MAEGGLDMPRYFMLNKPRGYITASHDERQLYVMQLFPEEIREGLFPVGRLDKDTEGLLLVTDDGKLCFDLMNPESKIEKTYFLWAKGIISEEDIKQLESGVKLSSSKSGVSAPAKVEILEYSEQRNISHILSRGDSKKFLRRSSNPVTALTVTITEGKKHQVKKMLLAVRSKVFYLKRLSIADIKLDEALKSGEYRPLTDAELSILKEKIPLIPKI